MTTLRVISTVVLLACLTTAVLAQTSASHRLHLSSARLTGVHVTPPKPVSKPNPHAALIRDERESMYTLATNADAPHIVASLDEPMPEGVRLTMQMSSAQGVSAGVVDLSHAIAPVEVVRNISRGRDVEQTIRYAIEATPAVEPIQRRLTLTITE